METESTCVPLRSRIKEVLLACLYYSGLLSVLVRMRLRNRAVILMYHRVLPTHRMAHSFSASSIVVSPDTFDWQMRLVAKLLCPVTADQFVTLLRSGQPLPDRTCLVTFDDGWHDNLEFALPVLQRHHVPAVLFVATDYIGTGLCFWQERIARVLFALRKVGNATSVFDELGIASIRTLSEGEARRAIRAGIEQLKARSRDELELLAARLLELSPQSLECGEDRFLSWNEVLAMTNGGLVAIGSHAESHTPLTLMPLAAVNQELRNSALTIRTALNKNPLLLAYPNGNANASVSAEAQNIGYAAAFTTVRGLVSVGSDPYLLPRVNVHESVSRSRAVFLGRIAGLI